MEKDQKDFIEKIKKLPPEDKQSFLWLMQNRDIVKALAFQKELSNGEIISLMKGAVRRNDTYAYALLFFLMYIDIFKAMEAENGETNFDKSPYYKLDKDTIMDLILMTMINEVDKSIYMIEVSDDRNSLRINTVDGDFNIRIDKVSNPL